MFQFIDRPPLLLWIDGTDRQTDRRTLNRFMTFIAYYVDARNKFARVLETSKTRYNAKPDTNPPGYAPSLAASIQRLICTCTVARTLPPSGECQSNSVLWLKLVDKDKKIGCRGNVL